MDLELIPLDSFDIATLSIIKTLSRSLSKRADEVLSGPCRDTYSELFEYISGCEDKPRLLQVLSAATKHKILNLKCLDTFILTQSAHVSYWIKVKQFFTGNINHIIPISRIPLQVAVSRDFKDMHHSLFKFLDDIIIRDALHSVPNVLFFDKDATINIHWETHLYIDYVSDGVIYHGFYCLHSTMSTMPEASYYCCSNDLAYKVDDLLLCLMSLQ